MKILIRIFCITLACSILASCSKINHPPKTNEYNAPAASGSRESDQTIVADRGDIFSVTRTAKMQSLQGIVYPRKTKTVTRSEYMNLIRSPRACAKIYIGDACGVLLTNDDTLLIYTLYYDPYKNDETREISYYELPNILSDDILIEDTTALLDGSYDRIYETAMKGDMSSTGIILDRKNGILLSFSVNKDELVINSVGEIKADISDLSLRSAFCYEVDKKKNIVFTDKDGQNYFVNALSLESLKQEKEKNSERFLVNPGNQWKVVGGSQEKEGASAGKYLYLYNRQEHRFQKHGVDGEKVYEINLNNTPVKGDIIKAINTGDDHGLYLLCKEDNQPVIWYANETKWKRIGRITKYDDETEFRNIDDIWWMVRNEHNMYVVAFDSKSEDYPTRDVGLSFMTNYELDQNAVHFLNSPSTDQQ